MKQSRKSAIKTTILVGMSMLLVIVIALICVGNYFFDLALNPKIDKSAIIGEESASGDKGRITSYSWVARKSKDTYIKSDDNLTLHGFEINNQWDKWAIVIHGYGGQGVLMSGEAKIFYDLGYNVIIPDLRGCGESEGDAIGMGWLDRHDIINWIDYIISKDKNAQIVLYGVSMGGATVMMTTGENLPKNVKCAIEDCGYTSVNDEFSVQLNKLFGLPEFPVITSASFVSSIRAGYNFTEASCVEQVKKSKTPTLFIHGDQDDFVPFEMLDIVYSQANCPKEKLVIEGAGHVESSSKAKNIYWNTVENFLRKYVE